MLRRLEVGLIDEGVRVVRAVPQGADIEATTGLTGQLTFNDESWRLAALSPSHALVRALSAIDALASPDDSPIDVVHAWGDGCWRIALEVARITGACAAIEVWSGASLARVNSVERKWAARLERESSGGLWLCPDRAMHDALSRVPRAWPARVTNWGVHVPAEPRPGASDACLAISILATGAEPSAIAPMLSGLARAADGRDDLVAFIDAAAFARHPRLWRRVVALNLQSRLSVIAQTESRRQLVLHADALVVPERCGEHRSLVLEAMATGMALVCRPDPLVEATSQPGVAITVDRSDEASWERAFRLLAQQHDRTVAAGDAARQYVRERRLAHQHVRATLDAYAAVLHEPIPIAAAQ